MKRRDWLVSQGLATPGRGRLSAAAHAAIDKAVSEGMRFSDMPSGNANETVTSKSVKVGAAADEQYYGPTPEPRYNGGWTIEYKGKTVEFSGRNCCGNCKVSLDYHFCDSPTAVSPDGRGQIPVSR